MSFFEAILLGIIQGLSEFLPISSTAHLTIAGKLMGLIDPAHPEAWTAFIAIMQLGTMAAVMLYFYKEIVDIIKSVYTDLFVRHASGADRWSVYSRHALQIVIGTLPVVIIGLTFKDIIEGTFTKSISVIASSLIVLALILFLAEKTGKRNRDQHQTTWKDAIVIGMAQALALIPGSSRSGTTITAALFMGLTRQAAARFSFLLSIPAVFASGMYELYKNLDQISGVDAATLTTATVVSGIVGYASIAFLLKYLQSHSMMLFISYRIMLGVLLWGLVFAGFF